MTIAASLSSREHFTYEPEVWTCYRAPLRQQASVEDLLARSAPPRRGNRRFGLVAGRAHMLAELRSDGGWLTLTEASQWLFDESGDSRAELCPLEVASALADTGHSWSPAEDDSTQWRATATAPLDLRCELTAAIVGGGVQVRGPLAAWDEPLQDVSRAAIARLLVAAHAQLRFVRFTLHDRAASAVSFAAAQRLDRELPDSVSAVVAACRLMSREVRALLHESVAQAYLEMNG